MKALLDTSVLIASRRLPDDYEYAISIVSLAEMHLGVLRATGKPGLAARVRRLTEIEHEFDPIPVDSVIARTYAECAQAVLAAGRSPRVFDLLIAATARVEGAKLFTLNPGDFKGLEELVNVVSPTSELIQPDPGWNIDECQKENSNEQGSRHPPRHP